MQVKIALIFGFLAQFRVISYADGSIRKLDKNPNVVIIVADDMVIEFRFYLKKGY